MSERKLKATWSIIPAEEIKRDFRHSAIMAIYVSKVMMANESGATEEEIEKILEGMNDDIEFSDLKFKSNI